MRDEAIAAIIKNCRERFAERPRFVNTDVTIRGEFWQFSAQSRLMPDNQVWLFNLFGIGPRGERAPLGDHKVDLPPVI